MADIKLFSDAKDEELKTINGKKLKETVKRDDAYLMTVRNNKFHHTVFHPYEEIGDNKSYKIFEYSRLSSGIVLYNYVYIFEDR